MKKLIKDSVAIPFTDLFDDIGLIMYVDDIDSREPVFILADDEIDYSDYSDEELDQLSRTEARNITDLYTIHRIYQLDPHKLSQSQLKELQSMYRADPSDPNSAARKFYIDDGQIQEILDMLQKHDKVWGPPIHQDPDKNFAMKHDLNISPEDYAHIIHSLTVSECRTRTPYTMPSTSLYTLGHELLVFDVDKNFTLKDGTSIGNFQVYIKIDLTRTFGSEKNPIALISFHE